MKKWLIAFLFCLLPSVTLAVEDGFQVAFLNQAAAGGAGASGGAGCTEATGNLIAEGFEETDTGGALGSGTDGYDDSQVTSEAGGIDPDHDGTGAAGMPSCGSQSFQAPGVSDFTTYNGFGNQNVAYITIDITIVSEGLTDTNKPLVHGKNGATEPWEMRLTDTSGTLTFTFYVWDSADGQYQGTSETITTGQCYTIWIDWNNNTDTFEATVETCGTAKGTADVSTSGLTLITFNEVRLGDINSGSFITASFDYWDIDTTGFVR